MVNYIFVTLMLQVIWCSRNNHQYISL